jgi:hypothetical protein
MVELELPWFGVVVVLHLSDANGDTTVQCCQCLWYQTWSVWQKIAGKKLQEEMHCRRRCIAGGDALLPAQV